jgi:ribosomal protein S18 acetylase RimI-like enzyme
MGMMALWQRARKWLRDDDLCYLYACPLDLVLRTAPPPRPELRIVVADADTLPAEMAALPGLSPVIANYVRDGHLAILAATDSTWVFRSVAILGPRTYPMHGFPLALTHEDAYLEGAETHPEWRGRGVAPSMLSPTARELLRRGYRYMYVTVAVTNLASCKALEKGGATHQGIITAHRRLGYWRAQFEREDSDVTREAA